MAKHFKKQVSGSRSFILVGILLYEEHFFAAAFDFTDSVAPKMFVFADSYIDQCNKAGELKQRIIRLRWISAVGYALTEHIEDLHATPLRTGDFGQLVATCYQEAQQTYTSGAIGWLPVQNAPQQ